MNYFLIYPERRMVSGETIFGWAEDAFMTFEIDEAPESIDHAILLMEDAGLITVQRRKDV